MKKENNCGCSFCKNYRQLKSVLKRIPEDKDKKFVEKIFEEMSNAQDELNFKEAILSGSWPSSVEQLRCFLANAIKIRKENGIDLIDKHSLFKQVSDSELKIGITKKMIHKRKENEI
jgi:hypothetical protein